MTDEDRRFFRGLLLAAGVAFVASGYLAAFTDIGSWMIVAGLGAVAGGLVLFTRAPAWVAALTGLVVAVILGGRTSGW